ncbi:MAG: hypothetical protein R3C59_01080 [Planctomycetaceae bacterium]
MTSFRRWLLMTLIGSGTLIVLTTALFSDASLWTRGMAVLGAGLAGSSLCLMPRASAFAQASSHQGLESIPDNASLEERQRHFESWQQRQLEAMEQHRQRLDERQRDLAGRLAKYQEFLEYPREADLPPDDHGMAIRLSEQDRSVRLLLEAEAARVYEKIRSNGYRRNGNADLDEIRSDVLDLVQRVARIYSPNSENPLLETSFEQLARSASRICLHTLVLLERLPIDVKGYNINQMYGYLRRAVQSYGTYQQVAPWLTQLSRGAYVGRLAAGTNPVSLGAWWLATEVGRRGAQHLVENVVDRQGVAVLHDIITVIGAEVANVYGPGFRQRDAAWICGTELTELLRRFPVSRDSLTEALREITALPLQSEYDRIYLYRCVADHRAAGFRMTDSALLGRAERDQIARRLEHFFLNYIHGSTDKDRAAWQNDVESRLDLKLSFGTATAVATSEAQATAAVSSVYNFLTSVANVPHEQSQRLLEHTALMNEVPLEQRAALLASLHAAGSRFEPPDLDPAAALTELYLVALVESVVEANPPDPHIEELVLETACYFRRSREEGVSLFDAARLRSLQRRSRDGLKLTQLGSEQLRGILSSMTPSWKLAAFFFGVAIRQSGVLVEQPDAVLFAVTQADGTATRLSLWSDASRGEIWVADEGAWSTKRIRGYLIDDCEVAGGEWRSDVLPVPDAIVLSGAVLGGGYDRMFACLRATPAG